MSAKPPLVSAEKNLYISEKKLFPCAFFPLNPTRPKSRLQTPVRGFAGRARYFIAGKQKNAYRAILRHYRRKDKKSVPPFFGDAPSRFFGCVSIQLYCSTNGLFAQVLLHQSLQPLPLQYGPFRAAGVRVLPSHIAHMSVRGCRILPP